MVQIPQDLGLAGKALAPGPLLQELFGEAVGETVEHALAVAAGAGIPIPVPGAADVAPRLVDAHRQPQLAQAVQHVEPGEPGPDNHRVELGPLLRSLVPTGLLRCRHLVLSSSAWARRIVVVSAS